ncbi:hypothetical protein A2Y99_04355 [Candidatus Gottesmanbacteria bacterium RBG_13_37_7]|uniref:Steroid 5-alpha reductase C-terminal domain-containing protein n=1 Tax=Candidatus Gottesmanbacteria bacterium RBG_13_37_7 TaxID=1798369 RepID=A0A1F5YHF9_9BACT|nr:MAG: hypothetical protein A2Y99_04355 [Candidatus Gottesmanbacteria bacterium RBG_13_37_7]
MQKMNRLTLLIALFYGLNILIVFPLLFILLNTYFSLPVYSFNMLKYLGVIFLLIGTISWFHCVILFISSGKGTPVPTDPPKNLVTKGIYKYTRNPMYLSVLVILFGYFLLFGHLLLLIYPIIAFLFFHLFITLYEEPILRKKFGQDYIRYCQKIPRW